MTPHVKIGATDDAKFIEIMNGLVKAVTDSFTPEEVWIITIDNWFDHKWLRFSGIGVVDFPTPFAGVGEYGALNEFWQDKLTFPPFTPNRILSQLSYLRTDDHYTETPLTLAPHTLERQSSEKNLHNRVRHFAWSGAFFWYSTNTASNSRGSVMVYTVQRGRTSSWFAELARKDDWNVQETKGVSRAEVLQLLQSQSV
jgi:hypothetical protein